MCLDGRLQSCSRLRRDWATLSDEEKEEYITTVKTAAQDPQYQPLYNRLMQSYRDSFARVTQIQISDADTSFFLPWHRCYLLVYEDLLRLVTRNITIPFWDWSLMPETPYDSVVFDPETGFGNSSNSTTLCVTSGPFQEDEFTLSPSAGGGCLTRVYNDRTFPTSRSTIENEILATEASEFGEFHRSLQLLIHSNLRCFVGGVMCSSDAPNDPLYLLHLARLDRLFDRWQSQDEARANARYATENIELPLTFSPLLVSEFSSNQNLPYEVSVVYAPLQPLSDPGVSGANDDQRKETSGNQQRAANCISESQMGDLGLYMSQNDVAFVRKKCNDR